MAFILVLMVKFMIQFIMFMNMIMLFIWNQRMNFRPNNVTIKGNNWIGSNNSVTERRRWRGDNGIVIGFLLVWRRWFCTHNPLHVFTLLVNTLHCICSLIWWLGSNFILSLLKEPMKRSFPHNWKITNAGSRKHLRMFMNRPIADFGRCCSLWEQMERWGQQKF